MTSLHGEPLFVFTFSGDVWTVNGTVFAERQLLVADCTQKPHSNPWLFEFRTRRPTSWHGGKTAPGRRQGEDCQLETMGPLLVRKAVGHCEGRLFRKWRVVSPSKMGCGHDLFTFWCYCDLQPDIIINQPMTRTSYLSSAHQFYLCQSGHQGHID